MRSSFRRFRNKTMAVVMALATLLLLDAALLGTLAWPLALLLVPLSGYMAAAYAEAALRKPRRRARAVHKAPRCATAPPASPRPSLRVVRGGNRKPPNAA